MWSAHNLTLGHVVRDALAQHIKSWHDEERRPKNGNKKRRKGARVSESKRGNVRQKLNCFLLADGICQQLWTKRNGELEHWLLIFLSAFVNVRFCGVIHCFVAIFGVSIEKKETMTTTTKKETLLISSERVANNTRIRSTAKQEKK